MQLRLYLFYHSQLLLPFYLVLASLNGEMLEGVELIEIKPKTRKKSYTLIMQYEWNEKIKTGVDGKVSDVFELFSFRFSLKKKTFSTDYNFFLNTFFVFA